MDIVKKKVCLISLEADMGLIEAFYERAKEADPAVYADGKDNILARTDKIVFGKIYKDLKRLKEELEKEA